MVLTGLLGAFHTPGARTRSMLLHFAGGVVFAVVAVELLPDLVRAHAYVPTIVGFAAGTALMLGLRSFSERLEKMGGGNGGLPLGLLAATGVDLLIDGLMIGIGFAAGARQGVLLTIALTFELFSVGFAVAATLRNRGCTRLLTVTATTTTALLLSVGAVAGGAPLRNISPGALAGVLAFGSAALLFLVIEELVSEAHRENDSAVRTAFFFLGFLALFLMEMHA